MAGCEGQARAVAARTFSDSRRRGVVCDHGSQAELSASRPLPLGSRSDAHSHPAWERPRDLTRLRHRRVNGASWNNL